MGGLYTFKLSKRSKTYKSNPKKPLAGIYWVTVSVASCRPLNNPGATCLLPPKQTHLGNGVLDPHEHLRHKGSRTWNFVFFFCLHTQPWFGKDRQIKFFSALQTKAGWPIGGADRGGQCLWLLVHDQLRVIGQTVQYWVDSNGRQRAAAAINQKDLYTMWDERHEKAERLCSLWYSRPILLVKKNIFFPFRNKRTLSTS